MIIAITGANGHVGVNLCKALSDLGHEVRGFTHHHTEALSQVKVRLFSGDLLDKSTIQPFVEGVDVVFHLAARISILGDPDGGVSRLNIEGTRNMLNAARKAGVKRFIHFSSIHAFNQQPHNDVLDEQRSLVGEDAFAYDKSKAEGERMVLDAAREGFDAFVISPTAIIGPMDYEPGLLGQAFLQIYHHRIPALVPGGYDMVDVRDIVAAAITAIEKGKKGEKYLLSGKWHSIKEISMIIENFTGKKTIKTEMPFWAARLGLPFIFLFSRITGRIPLYTSESLSILINASRHISNEKARRELGFNPRPVKETIEDLFTWFGQNGNLTK